MGRDSWWGGAAGHGARRRNARTCTAQWTPGTRAAWIALRDPVSPAGGVALADVTAAACGGTVRVRWPEGHPLPGGARVLVGGRWRAGGEHRGVRVGVGVGVFVVRHVGPVLPGRALRGALRDAVSRRLERLFGARAPMAEALVTGRRAELDPAVRERYARSGLAHLLSISGLHLGFFAWWVAWLARRTRLPRALTDLLPALATVGYVWLLGWPAPATRAAAFVWLAALARRRERRVAPAALIALTALAVLLVDPYALHQVGAWLSVAAISGLVWGERLAGARGPLLRAVGGSFGAILFTAPVSAFAFGTVAPIGLVANLVAIPLAGCVVPGLLVALVASWLSAWAAGLFASGTGLGLWLLDEVARLAAAVPGGHLVGAEGWASAARWGAVAAGVLWVCRRQHWLAARRAAAVAALAAWLAVGLTPFGRDRDGRLTVHFLSVGQGDAAVLRTPAGRWIVIDGGPWGPDGDAGRRVVVPFLRRQGAHGVALVVASHGDADHLGGLPAVIETFPPSLVLEPGQPLGRPLYLDFLADVDASGAEWRAARRGDRFALDGVTLEVLHPDSAWLARGLEANENSLVVRVRYGAVRFVFPGDAGILMEYAVTATVGRAAVLKVGHHGSETATSAAWLRAVAPAVAVVSVGRHNPYGHPAPDVIARLAAAGVRVVRTDRDGTVTISTDGTTFEVETGNRAATFLGRHD